MVDRPRAADGWFPDPTGRAAARYWAGEWTPWVSDGARVWSEAPEPARRPVTTDDLPSLRFAREVLLPEVHRAMGLHAASQMTHVLDRLESETTTTQPGESLRSARAPSAPHTPTQTPTQSPTSDVAMPAQVPAPAVADRASLPVTARQPALQAGPRQPSTLVRWWRRVTASIGRDLGVHGLAYLGVLLLFVGVFGLVAFAFADVTPAMRPVAALAAAAVPFAAAALLHRSGADVVARALETVGGLLAPVMVITSMVDGYPWPPDPTGTALVVAGTVGVLVVAGLSCWRVARRPGSGLRFAIAPTLWLAAGTVTLGVGRPVPTGEGVAVPSAAQAAAMSVALLVTVLWARRSTTPEATTRGVLAAATRAAALPGLVVLATLAVATWVAEGWPWAPVLTAGLALALATWVAPVPRGTRVVVVTLWWTVVVLGVGPGVGAGLTLAVAAAGYLALLEAAAAAPGARERAVLALPAAGLALVCLLSLPQAAWSAGIVAGVAVWALLRRHRPWPDPGVGTALDVLGGLAPLLALTALARATDPVTAVATAAALTAGATLLVLPTGGPRGGRYWVLWWRVAMVLVPVGAFQAWSDAAGTGRPVLVAALGAVAVLAAMGPLSTVARPWAVLTPATVAWSWLVTVLDLGVPALATGLAVAALAAVTVQLHPGHRPANAAPDPQTHQTWCGRAVAWPLAGHLLAVLAPAVLLATVLEPAPGARRALAVTVALAATGFALTAAADDRDRSPLTSAAARRWVPRGVWWWWAAVSTTATVSLVLDLTGAVPLDGRWAPTVLAGAALVLCGLARAPRTTHARRALTWAAFASGALGALLPLGHEPRLVGLLALVATVLLARGRHPVMVWTAWAAAVPALGLVAHLRVPWFAGLAPAEAVTLTTAAGGGALLLVAAGAGTVRHGWRPRLDPGAGLRAPAGVGAASLSLTVLAAPTTTSVWAGWVLLVSGTVLLVVGVLARVGLSAVVGVPVAWLAALLLAGRVVGEAPWTAALTATALLVGALGGHLLERDRRPWVRWDVPLTAVAALPALTALGAAAGTPAWTTTAAWVAALVVAVAVQVRRRPVTAELLGAVAGLLALVAAGPRGPGWVALVLVALAAVHTGRASRREGSARVVRQLVGVVAATAAWVVALEWAAWSTTTALDATAVLAALVALGAAAVARIGGLHPSWPATWGGAGLAVGAAAVLLAVLPVPAGAPTLWTVVALAVLVGATGFAAAPLRAGGLRTVSTFGGLAAVGVLGEVLRAPALSRGVAFVVITAGVGIGLLLRHAYDGRTTTAWSRAAERTGAAAGVVALLHGLDLSGSAPTGDPLLLSPVVASWAVLAAALGVVHDRLVLRAAAPLLACGAWVLAVAHLGQDAAAWYTVPIGLALLAVVALWRADRRRQDLRPSSGPVVVTELVGVVLVVGATFVAAVTGAVAHAALGAGLGVAVAVWGVLTRVRRRVVVGVVVLLAALVLLVVVPLVALLPAWGGAGLWLAVAGVGLVAVLAATLLERGRAAVTGRWGRWRDRTQDWE